jgi:septal ring factor EnvC (AmiA/AmiB activator)
MKTITALSCMTRQVERCLQDANDKRAKLNSDIESLKSQAAKLTRRERSKQRELQKQIAAAAGELNSVDEDKAELDEFYGRVESREQTVSRL